MATKYEIFEYDVLVIGAGGAGLRAAIEASAAGVKVGLVCKSLLGKAHTVMAEGGMAAAMGLSLIHISAHTWRHRQKYPYSRWIARCARYVSIVPRPTRR